MSSYSVGMSAEQSRGGRPRSEQAREAVLQAVDDLLVDVGYAAMTMKGIAERAGVSRQTVYRWWSTKAEILLEASAADAREELALDPVGGRMSAEDDLTAYLDSLLHFLARSPAGAAYRALLGEAQHDPAVARLLAAGDVLGDGARTVIERVAPHLAATSGVEHAGARLIGPTFFWVMTGGDPDRLVPRTLAEAFLRETAEDPGRSGSRTPDRPQS